MQTANLSFLLLFLFGIGCAPAPSVIAVQADRKDPTELQINAAKNGHLDCDFRGECEPAVAMISVATAEGLSRCSGFLISDHEVLTNDHCFDSIPNREKACQGLVFAHFTNDVQRSCKRLSVRSHQSGIDSKDYALIELNEPVRDRKPLDISRRGFENNEPAVIFSVQATQNSRTNSFDGKQIKLNCRASFSTLMDINIISSADSIMTFGDCAIQEGNSGSPIININGEVGAVVQGYLNVKGDELSDQLQPYLLDGSFGEVAIATQTRCMPELVGNVASSCYGVKPLTGLYPKELIDAFGIFSEKILPKNSFGLLWKKLSTSKESEVTYISSPSCVSSFEVSSGNFSFTSSVMSYRQGINSRLQAEWRSMFQEGEKQTLFVVQKPLTSAPKTGDFVSAEFGMITIPVCGQ